MKRKSQRMALSGMMVALGTAVMMLGGVIPLATFCSPLLASLALVPVLAEAGRRWSLCTYGAVTVLSLLIAPDKESALLFAFFGYYPILKGEIDKMHSRGLRIAAKLGAFNAAAALMLLSVTYLLGMKEILTEYQTMGKAGILAFGLMANVTMLLYDRMLVIMYVVYIKRIRPKKWR